MTDPVFDAEQAGQILFSTVGNLNSEQRSNMSDLAFALGVGFDEWTLDDLRAAWILLGLARRRHGLFLAPFIETAREFGYRWAPGEMLAVLSFGSKVVRASLIRPEQVDSFSALRPSDFAGLPPRMIRDGAVFRVVPPSVDVEFYAQVVAA